MACNWKVEVSSLYFENVHISSTGILLLCSRQGQEVRVRFRAGSEGEVESTLCYVPLLT